MSRAHRHDRILRLIAEYQVPSQQELRGLLAAEGIDVTQATLSRDLRELDVVKGPSGYVAPGSEPRNGRGHSEHRLRQAVAQQMVEAELGAGMIVLRTRPGHANALAVELDQSRPPEVLGTIAGDDTIFVAVRSARQARTALNRFRAWAGHD